MGIIIYVIILCLLGKWRLYRRKKISWIIDVFIKEISKGITVCSLRWCLTWRPEMTSWPIRYIFMVSANGSYTAMPSFHKEAFYCMIAAPKLIKKRKHCIMCSPMLTLASVMCSWFTTSFHCFFFFFFLCVYFHVYVNVYSVEWNNILMFNFPSPCG